MSLFCCDRLKRAATLSACMTWAVLAWSAPARAEESGLQAFQAGRFAEAVQSWEAAAGRGDATAALYLGVAYDTGRGVAQDYRQALAWYQRAGEAGSVTGMFNAGVIYDAGLGAAPDPAKAASWYQRAAAQGYGRAEYNLGLMSEAGSGIPQDRGRAIQFYRAAAAHGIAAAQAHLAQLGVPLAKAGVVVAPPGDNGGLQAFERAQHLFLTRDPATAQQAVSLFRQAAEAGNPLAQYDLGYCYEQGIGVPADIPEAVRWFRMAAAKAPNATIKALAEAGVVDATAKVSQAQR